ncbi:MAG: hypothetical protein ACE5FH_06385 [Candidatus Zixiibacteriota bacterium]
MIRSALMIFVFLLCSQAVNGATVIVERTDTLLLDQADRNREKESFEHRVGAYHDSDMTLVGTITGLYSKRAGEPSWHKAINCEPQGATWWDDLDKTRKHGSIYYPTHLWRISQHDDIDVYDSRMHILCSVDPWPGGARPILREDFEKATKNMFFSEISRYFGGYLVGILTSKNEMVVASVDDRMDYKAVFKCPMTLTRKLDSVAWGIHDLRPAFSESDSTIWISFHAYNYIYIVDMSGSLLDSVHVSAPDFLPPGRMLSRIKSRAVVREWKSRYTPVQSFSYVQPGYFFLQYRTGWERLENDSIPLNGTLAWSAGRQPAMIDIDKRWQVAGTGPHGNVIFAEYLVSDGQLEGIVLHIGRIKP